MHVVGEQSAAALVRSGLDNYHQILPTIARYYQLSTLIDRRTGSRDTSRDFQAKGSHSCVRTFTPRKTATLILLVLATLHQVLPIITNQYQPLPVITSCYQLLSINATHTGHYQLLLLGACYCQL